MGFVHVRRHGYGFCCIMPSIFGNKIVFHILPESVTVSCPRTSLTLSQTCGPRETEMKNTFLPYLKEWLYLYLTSTRPRSSSSLVKTRGRGLSWMTLSGYKSEKNGSISNSKPLKMHQNAPETTSAGTKPVVFSEIFGR